MLNPSGNHHCAQQAVLFFRMQEEHAVVYTARISRTFRGHSKCASSDLIVFAALMRRLVNGLELVELHPVSDTPSELPHLGLPFTPGPLAVVGRSDRWRKRRRLARRVLQHLLRKLVGSFLLYFEKDLRLFCSFLFPVLFLLL